MMNRKIICIGIIGMFLLTGLTTASALQTKDIKTTGEGPDFIITDIQFPDYNRGESSVAIQLTIENIGSPVEMMDVEVEIRLKNNPNCKTRHNISYEGSGELEDNYPLPVLENIPDQFWVVIEAEIDPSDDIEETEEENNILTKSLPTAKAVFPSISNFLSKLQKNRLLTRIRENMLKKTTVEESLFSSCVDMIDLVYGSIEVDETTIETPYIEPFGTGITLTYVFYNRYGGPTGGFYVAFYWNEDTEQPFHVESIQELGENQAIVCLYAPIFGEDLPTKSDYPDLQIRMELDYTNMREESNDIPDEDAEENNIAYSNSIENPKIKSYHLGSLGILSRALEKLRNRLIQ